MSLIQPRRKEDSLLVGLVGSQHEAGLTIPRSACQITHISFTPVLEINNDIPYIQ